MAEDILINIKISVIIPIYNRIDWGIEAIDSVLNQTHKNLELIVIDDGSTEDVSHLIEKSGQDERITYIRQENKGPAAARNVGIQKASGKYIAFLDADDIFYPNKLEVQLKFMEEKGATFCHTSYNQIDIEGNVIGKIHAGVFKGQVLPLIIKSCPIALPTVMGKTSFFKLNPFPEHIKIAEDTCLWITVAINYNIEAINLELTKIRIHNSNAAYSLMKQLEGCINVTHFVINNKYLSQYRSEVLHLLLALTRKFDHIKLQTLQISVSSSTSLIRATIHSFRTNGVRKTFKTIYKWIRARI